MAKHKSIYIARDYNGLAWVHFSKPCLYPDGIWRDDGDTMICRIAPEENLFPNIKKGECVEFKAL